MLSLIEGYFLNDHAMDLAKNGIEAAFSNVLFDESSDGMAVADAENVTFLKINRKFAALFGMEADALPQPKQSPANLFVAETIGQKQDLLWLEVLEQLSKKGEYRGELTFKGHSEQVSWYDLIVKKAVGNKEVVHLYMLKEKHPFPKNEWENDTKPAILDGLFNHSIDGVLVYDNHSERVLMVNEVLLRMTGYTESEFKSIDISGHFPEVLDNGRHARDYYEGIVNNLAAREQYRHVTQHLRKDGSSFWAEIQTTRLPEPNKHLTLSITRDITHEYMAQLHLEESRAMFKGVFDNAIQGVAIFDENYRVVTANQALCDLFDFCLDDIMGQPFDVFNPAGLGKITDEERRLRFKRVENNLLERKFYKKNGDAIDLRISLRKVKPTKQGNEIIMAVVENITKSKQALAQLAKSEMKLKEAAAIAQIAAWELDYKMNKLYWSDEVYNLLEIPKSADADMYLLLDHVVPEDKDKVNHHWLSSVENKTSEPIEYEVITGKGNRKSLRSIFRFSLDGVGEIDNLFGIVQDITQMKNAMAALEQSEDRFRRLAENSPNVIFRFAVHPELQLEYVSPVVEDMFGYQPEELYRLGKYPEHIFFEKRLANIFGNYFIKGQWQKSIICQLRKADGKLIWVDIKSVPVYNDKDEIIAFEGVISDIDTLKQSEQKLLDQKTELITKNTELEQFTYIASHDLRSPVINFNALLQMFDRDGMTQHNLALLNKLDLTSGKLYETLHDLMDVIALQKRSTSPFEKLNFNTVITDIITQLSEPINESEAQIVLYLAVETVVYVRIHLKSIIQNLITNAIKYRSELHNCEICISTKRLDDMILLKVEDNGLGIDMDKFGDRIFGMFQVFHSGKGGKGLGLFIIKKQIEQLGGKIRVESELNKGTTFFIYLKNRKL
ncbi:PAS domain S-box protein [bacterium]|nr:PAS domain S-box protein [bacterium]